MLILDVDFFYANPYTYKLSKLSRLCLLKMSCPDSSVVEHLHGKQAVVGSIPILGKRENFY